MTSGLLSLVYLEEIRKRCEAATSGPWISYVEGRDHLAGDSFIKRGGERRKEDLYLTGGTVADQDFIAHARQDIPSLLEEVERLRKRLKDHGFDDSDT